MAYHLRSQYGNNVVRMRGAGLGGVMDSVWDVASMFGVKPTLNWQAHPGDIAVPTDTATRNRFVDVQHLINRMHGDARVVEDGVFGPGTLAAFNALGRMAVPYELNDAFVASQGSTASMATYANELYEGLGQMVKTMGKGDFQIVTAAAMLPGGVTLPPPRAAMSPPPDIMKAALPLALGAAALYLLTKKKGRR